METYELCLTVDNDLGVLARISSVFRLKMINIRSLHVDETDNPKESFMKIRMDATPEDAQTVSKLLGKKEDVLSVMMQKSSQLAG